MIGETRPKGDRDGAAAATPTAAAVVRAGQSMLRVPLFVKIVLANAAVVVLAVAGDLVLGARSAGGGRASSDLLLAGAAIVLGVVVNAVIVRLALRPLSHLEETAARVAGGDLDARVPVSPIADRRFARAVDTFNDVLDAAGANRRRLRDLAARAQTATEEERKRIARELHDGTAQVLAALRVRLRIARAGHDAEVQAAQLDRLSEELGEAIEEVRRIALGLRPPSLDMLGLAPAVEALARSVAETSRIQVDVQAEPMEDRLAPEAELALYRILQEALANVARHAAARRVAVRLQATDGRVELSVTDDGRGFLVNEALGTTGSLGLFGMQERAAWVGGRVDITSAPGRGTRVTAALPGRERS